jgi:hypothetical protein
MSHEITPQELELTVSAMTELELMRALLRVLQTTTTAVQTASLDVLFAELDRRIAATGAA